MIGRKHFGLFTFMLPAIFLFTSCSDKEGSIKVTTLPVTNVKMDNAVSGGIIQNGTSAEISGRGIVWNTSGNAVFGEDDCTYDGAGDGSFTSAMTGLSPNTAYRCRAYAITSQGTFYGNEETFTTADGSYAPQVLTKSVSDITETTGTINCEVLSDNGYRLLDRGVVWSTSPSPTIDMETKISDGRGTGAYAVTIRNLEHHTQYYVRAYAVNSQGTAYGEEISFTTSTKRTLEFNINGVVFKMVHVEGGTFTMGADDTDSEAQNYEKPAHTVNLDDYYLGLCEVTEEVWQAVMNGRTPTLEENPYWHQQRFMPHTMVSWNECQEFLQKINEITGKEFSLPTEAQWEYAAKGGKNSRNCLYSGSNDIESVCWYYTNAASNVAIAGTKSPNELGLYDMSGNVNEWCSDWYDYYTNETQNNPHGPETGQFRVMRGGSVINPAEECRTTHRFGGEPNSHFYFIGFRLALGL